MRATAEADIGVSRNPDRKDWCQDGPNQAAIDTRRDDQPQPGSSVCAATHIGQGCPAGLLKAGIPDNAKIFSNEQKAKASKTIGTVAQFRPANPSEMALAHRLDGRSDEAIKS